MFRPEILAMAGYVPGEQPQAGKFIKLNTNENPYPPPSGIRAAIEEALNRGLERYPDPMANAFRTRAAEVLGLPSKDWIMCGNGSDDILTILTRAFVGAGDLLRLPTPSYILYRTLAQLQAAAWEEIPFTAEWRLPPEFSAANERLKLAVLPNPNSPSGTMLPPAEVLAIARKLPCPLLVDEAYGDFANENCLKLVAEDERVLVSRTLSKSYALAGLRFGFVVAQPQIIEQLIKVKDSYNCDSLSIAAATAAISDQAWLQANRAKILATRDTLTRGLTELGYQVIPSQANFVWCTHPRGGHRETYEKLKAQHVLVRYMNYAHFGDGLRISVGTDDQIAALLALLK